MKRAIFLAGLGLLCPSIAIACSFVNPGAAIAEAVSISRQYWIASALLGGALIALEIYCRQRPRISVVTSLLLIFHPAWTVSPSYTPDCRFINVEASQAVLAVIGALLAYRVLRVGYRRLRSTNIASRG
jgi:hypothetical protein